MAVCNPTTPRAAAPRRGLLAPRRARALSVSARAAATDALECGRQLAALRARDAGAERPLLFPPDALAGALLEGAPPAAATADDVAADAAAARDLLATRFVDDQLLGALGRAHTGRGQEYNQAVLVGDGMCTRAFRLPWPTGTVIYLVAPAEAHERAEAALAAHAARAPRGCLLRRVDADLRGAGGGFAPALERAGFRADRLSAWGLQGAGRLGLAPPAWAAMFAEVANCAALESLVFGELPPATRRGAEDFLASFRLLGSLIEHEEVRAEAARLAAAARVGASGAGAAAWWEAAPAAAAPWGAGAAAERPWLFLAKQQHLSEREIDAFEAQVTAAEAADEGGFEGNFS
jgi:O-methyltransferase involved in polyketide biosynthesis